MTIHSNYWPPILTGIIAVIVLAILGLWIATENLSKGARILARSTVVSFFAAPGLLGGRDGAIPVPFGVLFYPKEAFSNWHLASACVTWIILAVLLWFNERGATSESSPGTTRPHLSQALKFVIVATVLSLLAFISILKSGVAF